MHHHKIQAHSPKDTFKKKCLFVTWRIPGLQLKKSDVEWQPESFCRRGEENDAHKGVCLCWHRWRRYTVVADLKSCSSAATRTLILTLFYIIMIKVYLKFLESQSSRNFRVCLLYYRHFLLWRQCQSHRNVGKNWQHFVLFTFTFHVGFFCFNFSSLPCDLRWKDEMCQTSYCCRFREACFINFYVFWILYTNFQSKFCLEKATSYFISHALHLV